MWRWVLLAIVLLLILLCRTRVGVEAAFSAEGVRLDIRLGWLRLRILPVKVPEEGKASEKKPKKIERPKKVKKEEAKTEKPSKKGFPFEAEDIKDALRTLFPALRRVLRRTRRGIRISPLYLSVTLGGWGNPAKAAVRYGQIQTAVQLGMPVLEKLVEIRKIRIHTDVDFNAVETVVEGEAGATFRIGTLIAMGCGLLFPALGWLLRARRRRSGKNEQTAAVQSES